MPVARRSNIAVPASPRIFQNKVNFFSHKFPIPISIVNSN